MVLVGLAAFAPLASVFGLRAGLDCGVYNAYVWLGLFPVAFVILLMEYLYWNLHNYRQQVSALATTDSLTRITNCRHFLTLAADELTRHAERQMPFILLFHNADLAVYQAKNSGRSRVVVSADLSDSADRRHVAAGERGFVGDVG